MLKSAKHPTIHHLTKLRTSNAYRLAQQSAIVQGKKIFKNLRNSLTIKGIFASSASALGDLPEEVTVIEDFLVQKITGLKASDGFLAEVALPILPPLSGQGKTLILDRLQDPGNLGTLLRTAAAFGWQRAICITPCVDPFNDKALRSSRGAPFLLPTYRCTEEEVAEWLDREKPSLYTGDLAGTPFYEPLAFSSSLALAMGAEAQGVSPFIKSYATALNIPIHQIESLNVAAAGHILMAALTFARGR